MTSKEKLKQLISGLTDAMVEYTVEVTLGEASPETIQKARSAKADLDAFIDTLNLP